MKDFATEFILNKYQRLQLLHNSPKGKVWRSIDQDSNQKVILRELSRFNPVYEELKKYNFSICPEIYFYTQGESSSTVIEQYIEGSTLADLLAQNYEFSPQQIQQMLSRLCHGLKELHKCGIIHRDIKPANLILQNPALPESLYLIDFDAARLLSGHKATDTALLGTRGYAPPEQYGFSQTDARSDIYALGCTFKKILGPQYHGRLIPILNKCCAIDPQARYQNVDKLLKALNRPPIFQCLAQHKRNILALGMAVGMTAICFTAYINYTKTEPAPAIPQHETKESQTETTLPSSDEAAPQVKDTTAPSVPPPTAVPKQAVSKPAQNIIYPQYYANGNPLLSQVLAAESPFPIKSYRHLADIFPAILLSASPSPIPPRPIWKALSCPLPTTIRPASATPAYSSLPLLQAILPKFPCRWRNLPVRSLYPWSSTSLAPAHNGYSPRKCSSFLIYNK